MNRLPPGAEGDEASKLYEQLMKQIERLNADKVGEFSQQCQSFGTCAPEQAVGTQLLYSHRNAAPELKTTHTFVRIRKGLHSILGRVLWQRLYGDDAP